MVFFVRNLGCFMTTTVFFQRLLLLPFILFILAGCVHQAMDYSIASWQHKPVAAVVASWGKPSEDLRVNGKHLLVWSTPDGKPALPDEKNEPGKSAVGCTRLLEAGRNGRIVAGTWDGNDCPGWLSGWYW